MQYYRHRINNILLQCRILLQFMIGNYYLVRSNPSLTYKCLRKELKEEEFEDTKGVIRMRISKKNRQHNDQKKKSTKGQTTIYKTYI